MPLLVRVPRVESVLREIGPYRHSLNVLDRKQTAVQRQLRRSGLAGYEPPTQATLMALVQTSRRPVEFFDIGAHIGLYSALAALVFPPDLVHVTAFEPTPTTADICAQLAHRNRVAVNLERVALSDQEGSASLFVSDKAETSNSLVAGFRTASAVVSVPTTTLDVHCLARQVLPTVLKVDVETFEPFVLRGASRTLTSARPAVVCELLPSNATSSLESLSLLRAAGYVAHAWAPDAGRWVVVSEAGQRGRLNGELRDWLFLPAPASDELHSAVAEWRAAIADCTEETNVLYPGGTPPPPGWDSRYQLHEPAATGSP